ncbi:MAG: VWA domain-containing protein, partial [Desulfobacula sp.]|nr:VWA domain-containing protein [Desulfobacula sp.]
MFLLNENKLTQGKESDTQSFSEKFSLSISGMGKNIYNSSKEADIMFVFDCTGSMMSEITAMKDAIFDFANSLITDGLNIRLGLIEFRDRLVNQEHKLHLFSDEVFTHNANLFMEAVGKLKAKGGGGNGGESSLDAIMLALEQPFRNNQNKTIVLITDDAPHIPDKSTDSLQTAINKMKRKAINQCYIVTMLKKTKCHKHLELLEGVQKYGG